MTGGGNLIVIGNPTGVGNSTPIENLVGVGIPISVRIPSGVRIPTAVQNTNVHMCRSMMGLANNQGCNIGIGNVKMHVTT